MLLKILPFLKNSPLSLPFVPLSVVPKSRTSALHWKSLGNRFVHVVRGAEKVGNYSKIERIFIYYAAPYPTHAHMYTYTYMADVYF